MENILFYYRSSCSHSKSMLESFKKHNIQYELVDISAQNETGQEQLKSLTGGYLSVPTLVFPHGEVWIEPPIGKCIHHIRDNYPTLIHETPSFLQSLFKKL